MKEDLRRAFCRERIEEHGNMLYGFVCDFSHSEGVFETVDPRNGNRLRMCVRTDSERIASIAWNGSGSVIFRASCSMLCASLEGLEREQARAFAQRLIALLTTAAGADCLEWEGLGDVAALSGIRHLPGRITCALMPWRAFLECTSDRSYPEPESLSVAV